MPNGKERRFLWGAAEIGAAIGRTERQAFYLLEAGSLPAKKVGRQWVAEHGKLLAAVVGDDAETEAA
jgi:hypothetical protein